jgi:aminoglycoside phosphotransferase (APT) family kinase protein
MPGELLGQGREAEILAWGDRRVVRLMRDPGTSDRLVHEAAAIAAARAAGVSAPAVYETVVVDGRPGLVMDRVDGVDLLTALGRRPWRLAGSARALGRIQARLHDAVAPPVLRDLRPMLRERIDAAPHLRAWARSSVLDLLDRLSDGDRVCHGDFHPGNVIVCERGAVVIDWTGAARGDPTADLARTILLLRAGAIPPHMGVLLRTADRVGRGLFRRLVVRAYRRARDFDAELTRRWETVWAAARLAEGIEEEVPTLLSLLEARLIPNR